MKFVLLSNFILYKYYKLNSLTAVITNMHPQRVSCSVQTCGLVDGNQPLPWFSRIGQEKSLSLYS